MMHDDDDDASRSFRHRGWSRMFSDAARGMRVALRGEVNFFLHFFIAAVAAVAGGIITRTDEQWCLFLLCVTIVLTAEMFNTAIEHLARAITRDERPEIRDALDVASGAVLMAAIGAATVGVLLIAWPFVVQMK
jgi:diacylglycerol kinase